jgi:dienelactone hydrolase
MPINQFIEYDDHGTLLEGYLSVDSDSQDKKPVVIVAHDWSGRNTLACAKADQLASLGYIGFALDMYGKNIIGRTKEEKSALIQPLLADRALLLSRIIAALETVKKIPQADTRRIAAIGFCFGGLCVLDLARSGADIAGVVSFHGLLNSPSESGLTRITAKVLALHGYNDPMVTPDSVMAFGDEMTAAQADWQLHMYGNTMHAFTNPEANDPDFGTVYSKTADMRSWRAMLDFFNEIFK